MKKLPNPFDAFEQQVIFRVARGFFFAIALGAVLVFFGSGAGIGWSFVKVPIFAPPDPADVAPPPRITMEMVEASLNRADEEPEAEPALDDHAAVTERSEEGPEDPHEAEIARLSALLRELLPEPTYAWQDQFQTVCTYNSPYGCLRTEERLAKNGMLGVLRAAVQGLRGKELVDLLQLQVDVLTAATVERRGALILPTAALYREVNAEYLAAVEARAAAIAKAAADVEQRIAERDAFKASIRAVALTGVVSGFGALVLGSLFLAFLAMERHLRVVEARLLALAPPAAAAPVPEPIRSEAS